MCHSVILPDERHRTVWKFDNFPFPLRFQSLFYVGTNIWIISSTMFATSFFNHYLTNKYFYWCVFSYLNLLSQLNEENKNKLIWKTQRNVNKTAKGKSMWKLKIAMTERPHECFQTGHIVYFPVSCAVDGQMNTFLTTFDSKSSGISK